jgi:hypothetical protein
VVETPETALAPTLARALGTTPAVSPVADSHNR